MKVAGSSLPRAHHERRAVLGGVAGCCLMFVIQAFAAPNPAVDALFAPWSGTDRPGCALAVQKSGAIAYERGYGMANLEAGVANTPDTIFDIGSVSKQFTAMAVLLLEADGKLSLDDDIRKYLPEMPDYGSPITIAHLLHHTSGLRAYTDLLDLVGIPEVDLTTRRDALELITRQRQLNFRPGDEFLYSDTNYFLAGEIVQRVSGQSLRQFSAERIFAPLGMRRTQIEDEPRRIVRGRAIGYEPVEHGFLNYLSNFEQVGDGAVLSSVRDLARWQRNFDTARVGGRSALSQMVSGTTLNNGSRSDYGLGVFVDTYRGIPWIHHDGEWVGYRAAVSRFPTEDLSVIVTCNVIGDLDPMALSLGVADQYLTALPPGRRPTATSEAPKWAGLYWNSARGLVRRISSQDGVLLLGSAQGGEPLLPDGAGGFRDPDAEAMTSYRFLAADDRNPMRLEARSSGATQVFVRVLEEPARPAALAQYAGRYVSAELPGAWDLIVERGQLLRRQSFAHDAPLTALFEDTFLGSLSEGPFVLHFQRDAAGSITGFSIASEGLRPMPFERQRAPAQGTPR